MSHAALPSEYEGRLSMIFCNDAERAYQVRLGLGRIPALLVDFICNQGVQFAILGRRSTPSRTIAQWYPFGDDALDYGTGIRSFDAAAGWYDPRNKVIAITRSRDPERTVIHEVGHALDYLLYSGLRLNVQRHYRRGRAVTAYGNTNAAEYWAEAFRVMYHPGALRTDPRDAIERAGPELLDTIRALPELVAR